MKPPICAICSKLPSNHPAAGMVQFSLNTEEAKFNGKINKPGFVGHPLGLAWFCEEHKYEAKSLMHLSAEKAIHQMKTK